MMSKNRKLLGLSVVGVAIVAGLGIWWSLREPRLRPDVILAGYDPKATAPLAIQNPAEGAVFPPKMAPPVFSWDRGRSNGWLVRIEFAKGDPLEVPCDVPEWTPSRAQWETIQARSRTQSARVTILGVDRHKQHGTLAAGSVSIRTSADPVGAPIFYREVVLPFSEAVRDPSKLRWRFGDITEARTPPIVLEGLPVCGNCHSFSADGSLLGMDVDYANDKASYAIVPVAREMALDGEHLITWSDYRPGDGVPTFGLLSQVSPDGRYVVSTVKDRSVFVPRPDLTISQLFFPIKGILVVYDRQTGEYRALPGADDPKYVQSNPTWSPDGKFIVFARSEAYELKGVSGTEILLAPEQCAEFLEGRKTFQYDLYRIPFNEGRGGEAEPLAGASGNGLSNYFPKYSPDGRWIVFCRAKSFMLLQPDSELFIIPAEGGAARRLECNTGRMNSWHSWSPNSRWLVFSSKANTPYTQLFLTHIDEAGRASPPVVLAHFTASDRAANIPEFVRTSSQAIARIHGAFVDAHSYVRVAAQALRNNNPEGAERAARKALAMDKNSAEALANLGAAKLCLGQADEARKLFEQARHINPKLCEVHFNLGVLAMEAGDYEEAARCYREGLKVDPHHHQGQYDLGCILLLHLDHPAEAIAPLTEAVRLMPGDPDRHYHLAMALKRENRLAEASAQLREAIQYRADDPVALCALAWILAEAEDSALRNPAEAVELAEQACRATRYSAIAPLQALSAAHASAGQYQEALQYAQRALQLLHVTGHDNEAQVLAERMRGYAAHLPQPSAEP